MTFLANGGALPLLVADGTDLKGVDGAIDPAHVTVERVHLGRSVDVNGQWRLATEGGGYTALFNADATAADLELSLNSASATTNLMGAVAVTRSEVDFTGGYKWQITFSRKDGDVATLVATDSSLTGTVPTVAVVETRRGTVDEVQVITTDTTAGSLQNTFFLAFNGEETDNLNYDASETTVKAELEKLSSVGSVEVSRTVLGSNAYCWSVTFTHPLTPGKQPKIYAGGVSDSDDLSAHPSTLTSSDGSATVSIAVTTFQEGTLSPINGDLVLGLTGILGERNVTVPHDASAEVMKAALEQPQLGVGLVTVARTPAAFQPNVGASSDAGGGAYGGYSWTITFREKAGDVPTLSVETSSLSSTGDVAASITTDQEGTAACCVDGSVVVSYCNGTTPSECGSDKYFTRPLYMASTTPEVLSSALGALPGVGEVSVSTEKRVNGGARWRVTFLDWSAGDRPQLNLNSGWVDGTRSEIGTDRNMTNLTVAGKPVIPGSVLTSVEIQPGRIPMTQRVSLRSYSTLRGTFALGYGGLLTRPIPWDATAWEVQAALQSALFESVAVKESARPSGYGQANTTDERVWDGASSAWDITFLSVAGNLLPLDCDDADVTEASDGAGQYPNYGAGNPGAGSPVCVVETVESATSSPLSGEFSLSLNNQQTVNVPFDATSHQVEAALKALDAVGEVSVSRRDYDLNGGIEWLVTFMAPNDAAVLHVGDVASLVPITSHVGGTASTVVVDERVRGSYLGGTYTLSFAGEATVPLLHDASAEHVQLALEALTPLNMVHVTRSSYATGYRWTCTFSSLKGSLALLGADYSNLEGTEAQVRTIRTRSGTAEIRGGFKLGFGSTSAGTGAGVWTQVLSHDSTAAEMEAALESLPTVGDVVVTTASDADLIGKGRSGYGWDVTFTGLGEPLNLGDLPLLSLEAHMLSGSNVVLGVEESQAGCCAVELSFNAQDFTSNQVPYKYDEAAVVLTVYPQAGSVMGGTPITVSGSGFVPTGLVYCVFGASEPARAVWVSPSEVTCVTPPHPAASVVVVLHQHSHDDGSLSRSLTVAVFRYEAPVTIEAVHPFAGPSLGKTNVTIYGYNFVDHPSLACLFTPTVARNGSSRGASINVSAPAFFHNKSALSCLTPDLSPFFHPTDLSWASSTAGHADVRVTANGVDFAAPGPLRLEYLPLATVDALTPVRGAQTGSTLVTVTGSNFFDSPLLSCRFGSRTPVPATFMSSNQIRCTSPPHDNIESVQEVRVQSAGITHEVQVVELSTVAEDVGGGAVAGTTKGTTKSTLGGGFTLTLEGYETGPISPDADSSAVRAALEALPPTGGNGSLLVNRTRHSETVYLDGYSRRITAWAVTFTGRGGDVAAMHADTLGLLNVTAGDAVTVRTEVDGSTATAEPEVQVVRSHQAAMVSEVQVVSIASAKLQREVQEIWLSASEALSGEWKPTYNGVASLGSVDADASDSEVKAAMPSFVQHCSHGDQQNCTDDEISSWMSVDLG